MSVEVIGSQKIKSVSDGQVVDLKTFWQDQNAVVVFFRRWGCMLCRLWAKELSEIAPVLKKHNIRLVGVGVEENGVKEFIDGKYFDSDLYYVEKQSTYNVLGFKHFSTVAIVASLFWKQSRDAIFKGKSMGLTGDLKGDWGQTGGALLVEKGGKIVNHFVQKGPGDHLTNLDILKHFGLENEYKAETMANKQMDDRNCNVTVAATASGGQEGQGHLHRKHHWCALCAYAAKFILFSTKYAGARGKERGE